MARHKNHLLLLVERVVHGTPYWGHDGILVVTHEACSCGYERRTTEEPDGARIVEHRAGGALKFIAAAKPKECPRRRIPT